MGIPIKSKDFDDWGAKDFCLYIKQKLSEKGIFYMVKYPSDVIAFSAILKVYRKMDKSNYALQKYIDQIIDGNDLTNVQNLSFIRTLALSDYQGTSFAAKKKAKKKQNDIRGKIGRVDHEPPQLNHFTTMWLQSLKTGV